MGERSSSDSVINNIHVVGKKPGDTSSSLESPLQQSNDDEDITPPNPYNELGYGFTAYFNLLRTLIWLFVLFTLIMMPAYYIYGSTDGLHIEGNPRTVKAKLSLGNLGFSGSTCIS